MKKVVDDFVKPLFKLFRKPIADEKKQTTINLTKEFYKKIQKKTRDVGMGPKIKYKTSEIASIEMASSEMSSIEMASMEMASSEQIKCKKKKKTNETAGMSCEKAICLSNNDENHSKICIDRCDEELVKKLVEPFTQFQKDNLISALTYTGYSDNKTDFVDVNGKTYSVKSNIRKNGKVCPQVIGQPTKRTFIENVYNPINNIVDLQDVSISDS